MSDDEYVQRIGHMAGDFSEDEIQDLYAWVDTVPLSRPKRNIARDFSDGVLIAETVSLLLYLSVLCQCLCTCLSICLCTCASICAWRQTMYSPVCLDAAMCAHILCEHVCSCMSHGIHGNSRRRGSVLDISTPPSSMPLSISRPQTRVCCIRLIIDNIIYAYYSRYGMIGRQTAFLVLLLMRTKHVLTK